MDFLWEPEADPIEKTVLEVREVKPSKPIECNIESAGISSDEPVFNADDYLIKTPEQDTWQRRAETHNTTFSQPLVITIASYYHCDLPEQPSIKDMAHFNKLSRRLIEQNFKPTHLNFNRDMLGLPIENQVLTQRKIYVIFPIHKSHHSLRSQTF